MGKKWGDKVEGMALVVKLCKAFAVAAVVIGLLTGSIFGYNFEDRRWILVDIDVNAGKPMILSEHDKNPFHALRYAYFCMSKI